MASLFHSLVAYVLSQGGPGFGVSYSSDSISLDNLAFDLTDSARLHISSLKGNVFSLSQDYVLLLDQVSLLLPSFYTPPASFASEDFATDFYLSKKDQIANHLPQASDPSLKISFIAALIDSFLSRVSIRINCLKVITTLNSPVSLSPTNQPDALQHSYHLIATLRDIELKATDLKSRNWLNLILQDPVKSLTFGSLSVSLSQINTTDPIPEFPQLPEYSISHTILESSNANFIRLFSTNSTFGLNSSIYQSAIFEQNSLSIDAILQELKYSFFGVDLELNLTSISAIVSPTIIKVLKSLISQFPSPSTDTNHDPSEKNGSEGLKNLHLNIPFLNLNGDLRIRVFIESCTFTILSPGFDTLQSPPSLSTYLSLLTSQPQQQPEDFDTMLTPEQNTNFHKLANSGIPLPTAASTVYLSTPHISLTLSQIFTQVSQSGIEFVLHDLKLDEWTGNALKSVVKITNKDDCVGVRVGSGGLVSVESLELLGDFGVWDRWMWVFGGGEKKDTSGKVNGICVIFFKEKEDLTPINISLKNISISTKPTFTQTSIKLEFTSLQISLASSLPILKLSSPSTTRPAIDISLKSQSKATPHENEPPKDLNEYFSDEEQDDEEEKSWLDIGSSKTKPEKRDKSVDRVWFRESVFEGSNIFVSGCIPTVEFRGTKSEFDYLQLLLNFYTLSTLNAQKQPSAHSASEFPGPMLRETKNVKNGVNLKSRITKFSSWVEINEVSITLDLSEITKSKLYKVRLSQITAFVVDGYSGSQLSCAVVEVGGVFGCDESGQRILWGDEGGLDPRIKVTVVSEENSPQKIKVKSNGVNLNTQIMCLEDLKKYFSEPVGITPIQIPPPTIDIHLQISKSHVLLPTIPPLSHEFKANVEKVNVYFGLRDGDVSGKCGVGCVSLFVAEDCEKEFKELVKFENLKVLVDLEVRDSGNIVFVDFTSGNVVVEVCTDSLNTLIIAMEQYGVMFSGEKRVTEKKVKGKAPVRTVEIGSDENILDQIEENVFKLQPANSPIPSIPDQIHFDETFFARESSTSMDQSILFIPNPHHQPRPFPPKPNPNNKPSNSTTHRVSDGTVKIFDDEIQIIEDYFSENEQPQVEKFPKGNISIQVSNFDVTVKLYDGYDWESTRVFVESQKLLKSRPPVVPKRPPPRPQPQQAPTPIRKSNNAFESLETASNYSTASNIKRTPQDQFQTAEFDRVSRIADILDDSVYITDSNIPEYEDWDSQSIRSTSSHSTQSTTTTQSTSTIQPPPLHRSKSSQIEIRLSNISMHLDTYIPGTFNISENKVKLRVQVGIQNVKIVDHVKSSKWNRFLTGLGERETESDLCFAEVWVVESKVGEDEIRVKVKVLPLRLYIDQDALVCLIRFFTFNDLQKEIFPKPDTEKEDLYIRTYQTQYFEVSPITVKIDYKPKRIDYANLQGGNFVEILNFFPLDGAEMTLQHVRLYGMKGVDRLAEGLLHEWLPYIRNTQVPKMVSGVSGVKSVVNLSSGIADLVLLPIQQYRKDGRVIRGLQKGAKSFTKAATMETLRIGTRLAVGTQVLLEHADEILSFENAENNPYHQNDETGTDEEQKSKLSDPPRDIKEGLGQAYKSINRNIEKAAKTIFAIPMEVQENRNGTTRAVIKAVPVAVLKPMIGATEAVSKTLLGLTNSIEPMKRREFEEKYKG
ncbi:autophagy- protein 2 [Nowakowskiella sp. JEL0407]|nr:autophagy- protein 2 [Nowakowskiella sp. JEL0407]